MRPAPTTNDKLRR